MIDSEPPSLDQDRIADPSGLFQDEPAPEAPAPEAPRDVGAYDLEGGDVSRPPRVPPPLPVDHPPPPLDRRAVAPQPEPLLTATVDQVWSRLAEWGQTLLWLAVVGFIVIGLTLFTFDAVNPGPALLILVLGGSIWVALTYPIVITMERPIRLTPEQAVRDYYAALSHHFPHYRRMWLLLSSAGRASSEFQTFEEFQQHWKRRLTELRSDTISAFLPLAFQVQEFKSKKSGGKTAATVTFTVDVSPRNQTSQPPLASFRIQTSLTRGPDNQWYLDSGTLPAKSNMININFY